MKINKNKPYDVLIEGINCKQKHRLFNVDNIFLTGVDVRFNVLDDEIIIESEVKTTGKTGVEIEALLVVSTAALTIYDMCKAVDKKMTIGEISLIKKTKGE